MLRRPRSSPRRSTPVLRRPRAPPRRSTPVLCSRRLGRSRDHSSAPPRREGRAPDHFCARVDPIAPGARPLECFVAASAEVQEALECSSPGVAHLARALECFPARVPRARWSVPVLPGAYPPHELRGPGHPGVRVWQRGRATRSHAAPPPAAHGEAPPRAGSGLRGPAVRRASPRVATPRTGACRWPPAGDGAAVELHRGRGLPPNTPARLATSGRRPSPSPRRPSARPSSPPPPSRPRPSPRPSWRAGRGLR